LIVDGREERGMRRKIAGKAEAKLFNEAAE
jgi:hypothetical protein